MKLIISFLMIIGCASKPGGLSSKAKNLEVFSLKPTGCHVLGKVMGINKEGSKELALNQALNQAASLGASGIFVNQEVPNGNLIKVYATAYQCE